MVNVFFDERHLMVAPVASSRAAGHGHLGERTWVFEQPVDDAELVAAVRSGWDLEGDTDLPAEKLSATWDPVRELFGNERYDETNYVLANRIISNRVLRSGRKFSREQIYIGATGWRNGNRDYDVEEARFESGLDVSDQDLAAAIRAAMAATFGPHDK